MSDQKYSPRVVGFLETGMDRESNVPNYGERLRLIERCEHYVR